MKNFSTYYFCFHRLIFYSQISEGGAPYSFTHRTPMQIDEAEIKAPTNAEIQQATLNNKSSYCVGVLKDVNLTENTAGTWVTHDDGSRSWFLKITSRDAIGLTLHYNNLFIPKVVHYFYTMKIKITSLENSPPQETLTTPLRIHKLLRANQQLLNTMNQKEPRKN